MPFLHGNFYSDKHSWGCADRFDGRRPLIDVVLALPFDKWCPRAQVLHKKKKKIERIQWKCYFVCKIVRHIRNFCSWKGHKTSFKLKAVEGVEILVCPVWVIGIPVPSSMTTSSLPLNSEWIAKFCKSEIMWCEAPESTIQLHDECSLVVLKFAWGSVYDYWRK